MKSGFSDKALSQVTTSDVRAKLLLNAIDDFHVNSNVYKELGLIISQPPQKSVTNNSFMSTIKSSVETSNYNTVLYGFKKSLLSNGSIIVNDTTFNMMDVSLTKEYSPNNLNIILQLIGMGQEKVEVDLDKILFPS